MARWLLIRHGQTDWNAEHRIQGHVDTGLSAEGLQQAHRLGEKLGQTRLDAVYSSDFLRARDTALAVTAGRDIEVVVRTELRERSYGDWEGLTREEIRSKDPAGFELWTSGDDGFTPPGGEPVEEVVTRMRRLIEEVRTAHPGDETVALVGHGGSLLALTVELLGLPSSSRRRFTLSNTGLSSFTVNQDSAVLEGWNNVSHWDGAAT